MRLVGRFVNELGKEAKCVWFTVDWRPLFQHRGSCFYVCAFPTRPKKKKEEKINIKKERKKERRRKQKNTTTHKIGRYMFRGVFVSVKVLFILHNRRNNSIFQIYIYILYHSFNLLLQYLPSLLCKTRLLRLS